MVRRGARFQACPLTRRGFLAGAATLAAGAACAAEDALLQALIRQNQQSEFGQNFDSTSRTILLPKSSPKRFFSGVSCIYTP